ncbi:MULTISPECIES: hypothetical protein [Pseudomonas syringae group genomosp. 2]|uniref:hypothetical protein n=1 Tax=Pseudomonas syringae group genomosp. 2 TaxID=251698 RepID=UPI0006B9D5AE|nr:MULTISPECIES: hypothetical protein [Pseudomonas syringae group genomosp. 2]KPX38369.1 hypothetical protein ALO69_200108 [Pseudomonas ficuserectae]KPY63826.1 hypothetical protein ALO93_200266 [Pseudomonas amygdali pv. sesami]RMS31759.1 hypothetical protein ALP68_200046 [Pseudomonas ficuserectae]RMS35869.1 hypothetical protein ALP67_01345 [Pseudomonas ficuserectae]RMT93729.1 hypothetical protein ALP38_200081 [Pseudomonas amygdali pv. sesami]
MAELFTLIECPDLYVDACACDEQRNLVFFSAWGRDTAIQEFIARLTLNANEGGIEQFHVDTAGHVLPVFPNVDMLEKRTTRQFRGTLFGSLLHLWLFDRRCEVPDKANHFAYALLRPGEKPQESFWSLVIDTCPLPLLQHWQRPVMDLLIRHSMLFALPGQIGPVAVWKLSIDLNVFQRDIGEMIRGGFLSTQPQGDS